MKKLDWRVGIVAILTIGGLEAFALSQGVNGALFSLACVIVGGIAGFRLRR